VPWLYAVWRGWPGVRWQRPVLMWLASGLACAAVVGAWLLPIWLQARHDPAVAAYFHELVVTHTVGRYVEPWHHYQPAWYYAQVIATLWLPLVALLPCLVPRWGEALKARDARVLLPLGFALLYLTFFTLTRGKRDIYILSALPMLALPAGYLLPHLLQQRGVQRALAAIVLLITVASLGATLWLLSFFGTPLLAGIGGGLCRLIFDDYHGDAPRREQTTGQAMVLGMIAGLVAAVLFVLAQLASNPNASNFRNGIPRELGNLMPFALIVGLVAGFTLEAVFDKIKRTDVLRAGPVERAAENG
jgi:hypothetical protein